MKAKGITVGSVSEESIADQTGIQQGDVITSVNGQAVKDILDYFFYTREEFIKIDLRKANGESWELEIEKDFDQGLGIEFSRTGLETVTRCANNCIFCFVDQMPGGMRESLYIKDDDYRLSFLQGSFITLTNLSENELERIVRLRLSPLYVSVHTTNPGLRTKIMGNKRAGNILDQLKYLASNGIEIHTQAVIAPEINDGTELQRTVTDLAELWPGVRSLAVVPVGLTCSREGLFPVRTFSREEASLIVNKVKGWQDCCLKSFEHPFLFASDEFYFLAGKKIPPGKRYAEYPQTENGVGLTRLFIDEWTRSKRKLPKRSPSPIKITFVTGVLGAEILKSVADQLNGIENIHTEVLAVENEFFGKTVTVSGLLTGKDILKHINTLKSSNLVILPSSLLRKDTGLMLDNTSPADIEQAAGVPVRIADGPKEIVKIIKEKTGATI
ncbi:MAG: DUF512 domain-containing protein [Bacillota bacterium]